MQHQDKFELIEKTIKAVEGNYSAERLISDCADKLSITKEEVRACLEEGNSKLLKQESKIIV